MTYATGGDLIVTGGADTITFEQRPLVIQTDTGGTGTANTQSYGSTYTVYRRDDPATFATNAVTMQQLLMSNIDGNVSFQYNPPARTRGRTLHRRNHRGMVPRAVSVDFSRATPEEIQALQLLRGLVGQDEFRRYLRYGFVMVRGASGLRYQIRRGRHGIDVWNQRGRVDNICCYLKGQFPPTDDVITRMLMAERDELELWRRGNSRAGKAATLPDLQRLCGQQKVA